VENSSGLQIERVPFAEGGHRIVKVMCRSKSKNDPHINYLQYESSNAANVMKNCYKKVY